MSNYNIYKLYYIDKNWCKFIGDRYSRSKYDELYFRFHNRNGVHVYLFWVNILVFCTTDYGSAWVNKA